MRRGTLWAEPNRWSCCDVVSYWFKIVFLNGARDFTSSDVYMCLRATSSVPIYVILWCWTYLTYTSNAQTETITHTMLFHCLRYIRTYTNYTDKTKHKVPPHWWVWWMYILFGSKYYQNKPYVCGCVCLERVACIYLVLSDVTTKRMGKRRKFIFLRANWPRTWIAQLFRRTSNYFR